MQQLRPYQLQALDDLRRSIRMGHRAPILLAPTGSGKTTIAATLIHMAVRKGSRIIFLAHRRELIDQCSERLIEHGVDHGVIMAGHWLHRPNQPVQVASIQTLVRREPPPADIIFIDEAHRAISSTYQKIVSLYPKAILVGLTATPQRLDGRGLGEMFDDIVHTQGPAELTAAGWLVPARVFAAPALDLAVVAVSMGDYNHKQLEAVVDRPKLIGNIVQHWLQLARDRRTIVFASGVSHSLHLVEEFRAAGVRCAHLDGKTPTKERVSILKRLASGELQLVSNCEVLTMGWDCPPVSCAVLARPTMSLSLYLQMAGRILRPYPGKYDALILDHAGLTFDHGFVTDEREWSLDAKKRCRKKKDEEDGPAVRICLQCYRAYPAATVRCPECGWSPVVKPREIEEVEGQLVEADPATYRIKKLSRNPEIAKLQKIAEERGYRSGWVWHRAQKQGIRMGRSA